MEPVFLGVVENFLGDAVGALEDAGAGDFGVYGRFTHRLDGVAPLVHVVAVEVGKLLVDGREKVVFGFQPHAGRPLSSIVYDDVFLFRCEGHIT